MSSRGPSAPSYTTAYSPSRSSTVAAESSSPMQTGSRPMATGTRTEGPTTSGVVMNSTDWLRQLPDAVVQYAARFERNGFETVFAVGLMDHDDLIEMGIGEEHASLIARHLTGPATLVSRWTPMIACVPVTVTVAAWLRRLPVDLSAHAPLLAEWGFDSVGVLKHIDAQDADDMGLSMGHQKALVHCARAMADVGQRELDIAGIELEDWLFAMRPPLDHYAKAIRLAPHTDSVLDVLRMRWPQVEKLVMRRGHQRLLYHYIVVARSRFVDPL
jgi:hypothetical protein